jgi:hypothetical protein
LTLSRCRAYNGLVSVFCVADTTLELVMKKVMPVFASFLLSLVVSLPVQAQSSARGSVRFMMEDGLDQDGGILGR